MFLSIKNPKDFPRENLDTIVEWLMSEEFSSLVAEDMAKQDEDHVRNIHTFYSTDTPKFFAIRSSDFAIASTEFETLHLSSVENYNNHMHLYQIGLEANKTSVLYWIVVSQTPYTLSTGHGLWFVQSKDARPPTVYTRMDNLWIAGNEGSTVLALDYGSSHLVT